MFFLPAVCHSIALIIALFVQTTVSPFAAAWLFFHFAGCLILLRNGYPERSLLWYACLAWLTILAASSFLIMPIGGSAATMFTLAALPTLAICLGKRDLKPYLIGFGSVVLIFACGLIIQEILQVHYTNYNENAEMGRGWPLLDPNNAAVIVNAGLIPSFYMALRFRKWLLPLLIFIAALIITHSKAGGIAAIVACGIIGINRYGAWLLLTELLGGICGFGILFYTQPTIIWNLITSFESRYPIWWASMLLFVQPYSGLGIGTFGHYYQFVREEYYTVGGYAHNDLLQIAIEAGIPAACVFFFTVATAIALRGSIVARCFLLAVFLQSMVEFQFYMPSISLICGVAMAAIIAKPNKLTWREQIANRETKIIYCNEFKKPILKKV